MRSERRQRGELTVTGRVGSGNEPRLAGLGRVRQQPDPPASGEVGHGCVRGVGPAVPVHVDDLEEPRCGRSQSRGHEVSAPNVATHTPQRPGRRPRTQTASSGEAGAEVDEVAGPRGSTCREAQLHPVGMRVEVLHGMKRAAELVRGGPRVEPSPRRQRRDRARLERVDLRRRLPERTVVGMDPGDVLPWAVIRPVLVLLHDVGVHATSQERAQHTRRVLVVTDGERLRRDGRARDQADGDSRHSHAEPCRSAQPAAHSTPRSADPRMPA